MEVLWVVCHGYQPLGGTPVTAYEQTALQPEYGGKTLLTTQDHNQHFISHLRELH